MPYPVSLPLSELAKVPFIDHDNLRGRVCSPLTFHLDGEWHVWLATPPTLTKIKSAHPVESDYFARERESQADIYFDFMSFISQRACWQGIIRYVDGIRDDIHNLGASLAKVSLFYQVSLDGQHEVRRFVTTETEYIFGVCRSIFDLLQEVVAGLWSMAVPLQAGSQSKTKELKKSFRAMVMEGGKLMDAMAIQEKWLIPKELAEFYHRQGPFFEVLRGCRDEFLHGGRRVEWIFVTEKGFAFRRNMQPFPSFGLYEGEHLQPDELVSLRPVLAHVITSTLCACEDFSATIQKVVQFPPEIAPGLKLFIRGPHVAELLAMPGIIVNRSWWGWSASSSCFHLAATQRFPDTKPQ